MAVMAPMGSWWPLHGILTCLPLRVDIIGNNMRKRAVDSTRTLYYIPGIRARSQGPWRTSFLRGHHLSVIFRSQSNNFASPTWPVYSAFSHSIFRKKPPLGTCSLWAKWSGEPPAPVLYHRHFAMLSPCLANWRVWRASWDSSRPHAKSAHIRSH